MKKSMVKSEYRSPAIFIIRTSIFRDLRGSRKILWRGFLKKRPENRRLSLCTFVLALSSTQNKVAFCPSIVLARNGLLSPLFGISMLTDAQTLK